MVLENKLCMQGQQGKCNECGPTTSAESALVVGRRNHREVTQCCGGSNLHQGVPWKFFCIVHLKFIRVVSAGPMIFELLRNKLFYPLGSVMESWLSSIQTEFLFDFLFEREREVFVVSG